MLDSWWDGGHTESTVGGLSTEDSRTAASPEVYDAAGSSSSRGWADSISSVQALGGHSTSATPVSTVSSTVFSPAVARKPVRAARSSRLSPSLGRDVVTQLAEASSFLIHKLQFRCELYSSFAFSSKASDYRCRWFCP